MIVYFRPKEHSTHWGRRQRVPRSRNEKELGNYLTGHVEQYNDRYFVELLKDVRRLNIQQTLNKRGKMKQL